MDEQKQPGISINLVSLIKANIEMIDPEADKKYNLRLIGLKRFETEDGKTLNLVAAFDVMHGVETPLFKFTCEFVARYERQGEDSMPWNEFSNATALAHIIPYLREFVSNTTTRLPAPVLMLDPINTNVMIADYERRKKESAEAASKSTTV